MSSLPALDCRELSVRFGTTIALDRLELKIHTGEVTALVGPNGAGKTTTLRAAAGLLRPNAGTIRIFDHDPIRHPTAARRLLALLPDHPALPPELTVLELLRLRMALYGLRHARADRALELVCEELKVTHLLPRRCGALSHGQAQRTALAAILLPEPRLIMVDEPMTALDLEGQHIVRQALARRADRGAAVLMTTHTVAHVAELAHRVLRLLDGRISAERPGTREVQELERWILADSC